MDDIENPQQEEKKGCCANSCFGDCNPCKKKDKELEYDSDTDKGEQPKEDLNFKETLKASEAHCRVKKTGRRPRDCPCLVVFFIFLLGMVYVTYHAFSRGDPRRLYMPTDFMGRICGLDNSAALANTLKLPLDAECKAGEKGNATAKALCEQTIVPFKIDLTSRPYLWFMSVLDPLTYGGVCVSYCPGARNKSASAEVQKPRHCPPELGQMENSTTLQRLDIGFYPVCTYDRADKPNVTFPATSEEVVFTSFVPYTSLLRRCIPDPTFSLAKSSASNSTVQQQFDSATSVLTELWGDIVRSWKVIVVSVLLSILVSFVFLTLIRLFTGLLVWFTILFTFVFLAGLSALTIFQGLKLWKNADSKQLNTVIPKVVFGIGIAIGAVTIAYLFLMLFLFMRIRKAIGIIAEASKAISAMPQIVMLPIVLGILYAAFLVYWIIVAVFLWSAGTPTIENQAVRFTLDTFSQAIFAYHIFALLWISNIFLAYEYTVVAGAVGSWYWRKDKRFIIPDPVVKTALRTLVFHFGSITFGALVVAIVQFIRILLDRAYRKVKQAVQDEKISRCYYAAQGFLFLFEHVIQYVNKHAYIQIALYGNSFFYAAYNAFAIIFRNAVQIGVVELISNVVLILGRVVIAAASALISWGLLQLPFMVEDSDFDTTPILVPVLIFIVSFVIASLFMTILSCAVDTVLQCFLIDMEMCTSDKSRKPYCTSSLSQFITEARVVSSLADKFNCHLCMCITCDCLQPHTPNEASDLSDGKQPAAETKSVN